MLSEENWFIEFEHMLFNQVTAEINPVLVIEEVVNEEWWKTLTPKETIELMMDRWKATLSVVAEINALR